MRSKAKKLAVILFWLLVWQIASMLIDTQILFASPAATLIRLAELMRTADFWGPVAFSCLRIAAGFGLAFVLGIILAILSAGLPVIRELLSPIMKLIKAVPVASFVILALFWFSSRNLSILISFLMVLPIIYSNVLQGIQSMDRKMLEMAQVYRIGPARRIRYLYLPAVLPYLQSACQVGLGFCWKSGVAAEVIGIPTHSIGRELYEAKLYLLTEDLFAWTCVIVAISVIFEKLVMAGVRRAVRRLAGGRVRVRTLKRAQGEPAGNPSLPPELVIEDLCKSYNGRPVLKELNLICPRGGVTCLMGASGIGKTTLLRILTGIEKPDSGRIRGLEGTDITVVFQEDRLCEGLDAFGNVALTAAAGTPEEDIEKALYAVGIADGRGKPISEFSGGMKRRTAIVRAAFAAGNVVLLDEPFQGLDEDRKRSVMDWLSEKLSGKTVLFITHDEAEAHSFGDSLIRLK